MSWLSDKNDTLSPNREYLFHQQHEEEKKDEDDPDLLWTTSNRRNKGNNVLTCTARDELINDRAIHRFINNDCYDSVQDYHETMIPPLQHQQQLPLDVIQEICGMVSDPVTFCRLAMTCRSFQKCVDHVASNMWKHYYQLRWTRSITGALYIVGNDPMPTTRITIATTPHAAANASSRRQLGQRQTRIKHDHEDHLEDNHGGNHVDWKMLYRERHVQDASIVALVHKVVNTELAPQKYDFTHLHQRPGMLASTQVEDITWKHALAKAGANIMDVLCAIANQETTYPGIQQLVVKTFETTNTHDHPMQDSTGSSQHQQLHHQKLQRFLAASIVFTLHCHEVVTQVAAIWERIVLIRHSAPAMRNPQQTLPPLPAGAVAAAMHPSNPAWWLPSTPSSSSCYEDMAVLLAHALRPVPELLQRTSSIQQLRCEVSDHMDALSESVQLAVNDRIGGIYRNGGALQNQTSRLTDNADLALMATIHHVMWSVSTSRGFRLRARYPDTREAAVAACSIQRVVQWKHHHLAPTTPSQPLLDCCYRWCHPVLIAILYQAVARRLDLALDIVFCPRHCFPMLRYYDRSTNMLWFLDLIETPGRILSLRECQELVERLGLTCEDPSEAPHHPVDGVRQPLPQHLPAHAIDTFWGQAPMEVTSVLYWLVAPLLLNRRRQRPRDNHIGGSDDDAERSDDYDDALEDQPHDFLLGQLVEGNAGSLMKFLNERLVFFTAILRFCELIQE